jgi:hypothetical protein
MKDNLLKEQLAESGLEMQIIPAIIGGIGALTGIIGGISQSQQAASQNNKAQSDYEEQKRLAQEAADKTNEYSRRVFEVDKQNYANTRAYEWETALRSWQYNQSIQDFNYLQAVKQYGKSVENTRDQITYNSLAAMQAYESEQIALNEIMTEDRFNRQDMLVAQLQSEGKAAMGQAGRSRSKTLQASIADIGRNAAVMDASLRSSVEQSQRNMFDVSMRRYGADMQAKASMMIRPEAAPELMQPTQSPERIWIEPMEVLPQAIQAPAKQSTFAPLISGLGSAAGSLAQVNWSSLGKQQYGGVPGASNPAPRPGYYGPAF